MDSLEGSTLELLHRRSVRTYYPGYTIILLLAGMIVSLPLVKVSVTATAGGRIINSREPLELYPLISGIVEQSRLEEFSEVKHGDTLLQLSMHLPRTRMKELEELERLKMTHVKDIYSILNQTGDPVSPHYRQVLRAHRTACRTLQLKKDYLYGEYQCAQGLYREQVIPRMEFEKLSSRYRLACTELEDREESFRSSLEAELMRLELENLDLSAEKAEILAGMAAYHILAPVDGILRQCQGIRKGTVLNAGTRVGSIEVPGSLLCECYVESSYMDRVRPGMKVRIRMEGNGPLTRKWLDSVVETVDAVAHVSGEHSFYRVRCPLPEAAEVRQGTLVRPGMRFTAALELDRATLASLLLEKLNRNFHPELASGPRESNLQ